MRIYHPENKVLDGILMPIYNSINNKINRSIRS